MIDSLGVEAPNSRIKLDQIIQIKLIQCANSIEPTTDDGMLSKIQLLELARIQIIVADLSFGTHEKTVG